MCCGDPGTQGAAARVATPGSSYMRSRSFALNGKAKNEVLVLDELENAFGQTIGQRLRRAESRRMPTRVCHCLSRP
jgi:hypothetical protein